MTDVETRLGAAYAIGLRVGARYRQRAQAAGVRRAEPRMTDDESRLRDAERAHPAQAAVEVAVHGEAVGDHARGRVAAP